MTRLMFTAFAAMVTLTVAIQMTPAAAQDADPQVTLFSNVNVFAGEAIGVQISPGRTLCRCVPTNASIRNRIPQTF